MGSIVINNVSKAYKQYPNRFSRLLEWINIRGKKYHELKWVLNNVNLNINSGESVGILGVNGAGKSTLLKIITGTTTPTTGEVYTLGKLSALLELGMGFHPDFTGMQNVYMSSQLLGQNTNEIEKIIESILDFADIGTAINQPVRTYSSGMQVRLAFSVATALRPDILIVDEALSVGDISFQAKCFRRINQYKEMGTTLLFVSHNLEDIVRHCERAIFLSDNRIKLDGAPRLVVNTYRDYLFGKSPKVTLKKTTDTTNESDIKHKLSNVDIFNTRPTYQKIEHRWGSGGAIVTDFLIQSQGELYPTSVVSGERISISFRTHFRKQVVNPLFGIMLKTPDGIIVYATNSDITPNNTLFTVKEGEYIDCIFSLQAWLNRGSYLISLGVTDRTDLSEDSPLDRRYDSILLTITNDSISEGISNLNAECILSSTKVNNNSNQKGKNG